MSVRECMYSMVVLATLARMVHPCGGCLLYGTPHGRLAPDHLQVQQEGQGCKDHCLVCG